MSDILKSEIVPASVKVDKKVSSTQITNESKKEGNSLFDNMLKQTKEESVDTKNDTLKKNDSNTLIDKNLETKVQEKNQLTNTNKQSAELEGKTKTTTSLLDRMVQNIETKQTEESQIKKVLKTEEESSSKVKIDTTQKIVKNNQAVTNTANLKNEKIEDKSSSLLDRMVDNIKDEKIETLASSDKIDTKEESVKPSLMDTLVQKATNTSGEITETPLKDTPKVKTETVVQKVVSDTKETSLMDKMIQKSQTIVNTQTTETSQGVEEKIVTKTTVVSEVVKDKEPLQANMFLSNQKTNKELLSQQKITEVKESLENEKNGVKTIERAAKTLELNPDKAVVEKEESGEQSGSFEKKEQNIEQKKQLEQQIKQQNNMLNRVFLKSYTKLEEIHNNQVEQSVENKKVEVKASQEDAKQVKDEIEMVVEKSVSQSITTRIIESKQKMNAFMSEVARNMYLNYKPPLTAFKINLSPANLGNIAIMMRSNKSENTLSVSLSMSQVNTLETFSENKSALQTNLTKLIGEDTSMSLEFGMQNNDSNSQFEQTKEERKRHNDKEESISAGDILVQDEVSLEQSEYM